MFQPRGLFGEVHVGVRLAPRRRSLERHVLRLEQPHLLGQHLHLQSKHLRHARGFPVQHGDALELHRLHAKLPGHLGVRHVRVFCVDSRCDESKSSYPRRRSANSARADVASFTGRVAKIAKRANLAVARGGVFIAKTLEIFPALRLQPSHLLRQALLVLRTNLRVPAHHLLLQRRARCKRAHLLAKTILLLLVFALALLRGVHLAREIRLVLLRSST